MFVIQWTDTVDRYHFSGFFYIKASFGFADPVRLRFSNTAPFSWRTGQGVNADFFKKYNETFCKKIVQS